MKLHPSHHQTERKLKKTFSRLPRSRAGFTLTETLITGALFGIVIVVGTLLLNGERARTRDAERLADMARLAGGFAVVYAHEASYAPAAAGCPTVGSVASSCSLASIVSGLDTVRDPGRYKYSVTRVPDRDDFGIGFRLERRYGLLAAGQHVLDKNGIH